MAKKSVNWNEPVVVICYNQAKQYDTRQEAFDYFEEAMYACEGAEAERYKNICYDLKCGLLVAKDS